MLGRYVRVTLGTRSGEHAVRLRSRIEKACVEGPASAEWPLLQRLLPERTFQRLAAIVAYIEKPPPPPPAAWEDLVQLFSTEAQHRIAIARFRETTWSRCKQTLDTFSGFLNENKIAALSDITKPAVEKFKSWRMERILKRKNSRGGRGLALDIAILHRVFADAVECELIVKNPVRLEGRPGDNPEAGAQPPNAEELQKLRDAAGPDRLSFLLLRHTGMRGSDVVGLQWREVDWASKEVNRLTQKR